MLTREQIERHPRTNEALAKTLEVCGRLGPEHAALVECCRKLEEDLAIAALELRERAAKVCEENSAWYLHKFHRNTEYFGTSVAEDFEGAARRIRALPLTPDGADQRATGEDSRAEQSCENRAAHQLPAEQVPDSASIGGTLPIASSPARAGEPRCLAVGEKCWLCGNWKTGVSCRMGRTQA